MAMSKKLSAPNKVNTTEDSEEENDTAQAKVASLKLIQSTHNIEDFPLKVPSCVAASHAASLAQRLQIWDAHRPELHH